MKHEKTDGLIPHKPWHYDTVSMLLHWTLAILLTALVILGWYMLSIEHQPGDIWYFDLHKSFGLVAAALIALRIVWRLTHKPAPLPSSISPLFIILSKTLHFSLYLCMILMPFTGFIGALYGKKGVSFFGLVFPNWLIQNRDLSHQYFSFHSIIAWILIALVALHILAGLKHLLIDKDGVFQRMWF